MATTLARPAPEPETRTRDLVCRAVLEHGPVTATALAGLLGLTPAAVRRHLDVLQSAGLVAGRGVRSVGPRGRGRPAKEFLLTDAGHAAMTTAYDDLATAALRFLLDRAGEAAVEDFAQRRIGELESRYAPLVNAAGDDVDARADALASALTSDGYAATTRTIAATPSALAGTQLCQGHCPVQHVAAQFPQLCEAETQAFSRLLGVHVQRLATLAHGEHVCTTHVPHGTSSTANVQHGNVQHRPDNPPSDHGRFPS